MDMGKKSLENTKPKNNQRRSKPMIAKAGATRRRTPYKYGGQTNK